MKKKSSMSELARVINVFQCTDSAEQIMVNATVCDTTNAHGMYERAEMCYSCFTATFDPENTSYTHVVRTRPDMNYLTAVPPVL
jgi:hypothetical protein